MALLTKRKYSFASKAADTDSFAVVSFNGFEALSTPYRFEIVLISEKKISIPSRYSSIPLRSPSTGTVSRM